MSLDVYLTELKVTEVYAANITHNLTIMAKDAGIYKHLWHPEEVGISRASELIEPLVTGLKLLENDPERFKRFNPENRWGNYEYLVEFVKNYLQACVENPNAQIETSR